MRSFLLWNPLFAFVVLATATVACGSSSSQIFSEFMSELQAGASCEELFAKRNSADPSDPIIDQMNIELSFIGCYSSSSERRDLAEQPSNPESEESSALVAPAPRTASPLFPCPMAVTTSLMCVEAVATQQPAQRNIRPDDVGEFQQVDQPGTIQPRR